MKPIHIAIIEDNLLMRELLVKKLSSYPNYNIVLKVGCCTNIIENNINYPPDVAIINSELIHVNGLDTAKCLKLNFPQTNIIILSKSNDEYIINKVKKEGFILYFLKELGAEELIELILFLSNKNLKDYNKFFYKYSLLSLRQEEVLKLICEGITTKEISKKLDISHRTIDDHRKSLISYFKAKNTAHLVSIVCQRDIINSHSENCRECINLKLRIN